MIGACVVRHIVGSRCAAEISHCEIGEIADGGEVVRRDLPYHGECVHKLGAIVGEPADCAPEVACAEVVYHEVSQGFIPVVCAGIAGANGIIYELSRETEVALLHLDLEFGIYGDNLTILLPAREFIVGIRIGIETACLPLLHQEVRLIYSAARTGSGINIDAMSVSVKEGVARARRVIIWIEVIPCGEFHIAVGHFVIEPLFRAHHLIPLHPATEIVADMIGGRNIYLLAASLHRLAGGAHPTQFGGAHLHFKLEHSLGIGRIDRIVALSVSSCHCPCTSYAHGGEYHHYYLFHLSVSMFALEFRHMSV